jgi:hypothetical protein
MEGSQLQTLITAEFKCKPWIFTHGTSLVFDNHRGSAKIIYLLFSCHVTGRVVDPDPDWIRIQRLVWIRIRIGNPDPGARKLRNFSGKMHFLVI